MDEDADIVRQGAFIALSLILVGNTNSLNPNLNKIIDYLDRVYSDKYEDILWKMGSILSRSILELGGRNTTIRLCTPMGHPKI